MARDRRSDDFIPLRADCLRFRFPYGTALAIHSAWVFTVAQLARDACASVERGAMMKSIICVVVLAGFAMGGPLASASYGESQADKKAAKQDVKDDKRDVKADRAELKRLRADVKAARKAGDRARIARDEAAIQQLEADMKADRYEIKEDKVDAKAAGKDRKKGKS